MATLEFNQTDGEIWFTRCRYDGSLDDGRDPFTGASIKRPRNAPLTLSEQVAIESILEKARMPGGPTNIVKVKDGGIAEVDVQPSSVVVKPRQGSPTPALAALLYELLRAGSSCIQSDDSFVVTNADHARDRPKEDRRVPPEFYESIPGDVLVVESAEALAQALGWKKGVTR